MANGHFSNSFQELEDARPRYETGRYISINHEENHPLSAHSAASERKQDLPLDFSTRKKKMPEEKKTIDSDKTIASSPALTNEQSQALSQIYHPPDETMLLEMRYRHDSSSSSTLPPSSSPSPPSPLPRHHHQQQQLQHHQPKPDGFSTGHTINRFHHHSSEHNRFNESIPPLSNNVNSLRLQKAFPYFREQRRDGAMSPQKNGGGSMSPQNNGAGSTSAQNGIGSVSPKINGIVSVSPKINGIGSVSPKNNSICSISPQNNGVGFISSQNNSVGSMFSQNNGVGFMSSLAPEPNLVGIDPRSLPSSSIPLYGFQQSPPLEMMGHLNAGLLNRMAPEVPPLPTNDTNAEKAIKYTRSFKTYPRDPMHISCSLNGIPIPVPFDGIQGLTSDPRYIQYREQVMAARRASREQRRSNTSSRPSIEESTIDTHQEIPSTSTTSPVPETHSQERPVAEMDCTDSNGSTDMENSPVTGPADTSSNQSRYVKRKARSLPDEVKDAAYWERRRKNNEAAKRSRDARRAKEDENSICASYLTQENFRLTMENITLRAKLRYVLQNKEI